MKSSKNIHLLPTDKPSRLYLTTHEYIFEKGYALSTDECQNQNIYITSDEIAKHGEYVHWGKDTESPIKFQRGEYLGAKKIILTTDQDLIKDGVQAIDDEFLEWFVKNQSCESVDIGTSLLDGKDGYGYYGKYKIIIPKEETKQECACKRPNDNTCDYCDAEESKRILEDAKKRAMKQKTLEEEFEFLNGFIPTSFFDKQETLEEVAEKLLNLNELDKFRDYHYIQELKDAFMVGIKYQQKHSYSEEEVKNAFLDGWQLRDGDLPFPKAKKKWFEQFKKK